jgi:hypothetical protein
MASFPVKAMAEQQTVYAAFPAQNPDRVREMVGASHGNFDRVKELLKESPELSKASWDWGFGDWETALGAASHMGRKDIAEALMANGARPDLFTLAMMDNLAAVKAAIEAQPALQKMHGPHGITLMSHAEMGEAAKVIEYLKTLPDADKPATSMPVADKTIYIGNYEHGIEVMANSQGSLAIRRGEGFGRILNRVEEHGFAPGGAQSVRVRFKVENGKAVSIAVHEPMPTVVAKRV